MIERVLKLKEVSVKIKITGSYLENHRLSMKLQMIVNFQIWKNFNYMRVNGNYWGTIKRFLRYMNWEQKISANKNIAGSSCIPGHTWS
jgi:hypothetical protein